MKCPVCSTELQKGWEKNVGNSFTGKYLCPQCGPLYVSGVYVYSFRRKIIHYHPACPRCGLETVVATPGFTNLFQCCRCHRKFSSEDGRISQYWTPRQSPEVNVPAVTWQSVTEPRAAAI